VRDVGNLNDYQSMIDGMIAEAIAKHGEDVVTSDLVDKVVNEALPDIANSLYDGLTRSAGKMLREHRSLRRGFVAQNMKRWREGFDLLEQLIVLSQETGEAINNALRPRAALADDALFEATISNHARAVQVARETLVLMVNGFPDGALGRWRTLHEIAVVTAFVSDAGQETAERYILHRRVAEYRRAKNYMEHHQRAQLDPYSAEEMDSLKAAHDAIVAKYGTEMKEDYGWASAALSKPRPAFYHLEEALGLDHWRPRYKWATANTHAPYRPWDATLATSENDKPVLLVGESNSGMTDPAHMTALSLAVATMPVIMLEPNVDRLIMAKIIQRLSKEIGETFARLDQDAWQEEMDRRARMPNGGKAQYYPAFEPGEG